MFKKILVALKFTPASRLALQKGIALAREHGARLHIFHALDYRLKELDDQDPKLIEIKEKIKRSFESEVKPLVNGFNNITFGCLPADPALEICKIARNTNSDLIILGSHQRHEKRSMGRIDYVGITILEKAPCPVMLFPS
ncbi:MAG: universal stress protein [Desulfobacterales bacterium]|nr:MAG: universal stress protein [Desulfobacterales bacterium]